MKSIVIIYFCVLLLTIVLNVVGRHPLIDILNRMARTNETINRVFDPSKNGLLGETIFSVYYKGIFHPKKMEVAMKFMKQTNWGENEYKLFTYLNAINDENVEAYGIPSIYYYGTWDDRVIMATTLFDSEFQQCYRDKKINEIDLLIVCREIVKTTKYINSRGVFHKNIDFRYIQFHKHRGFIYDLVYAERLSHDTREEKEDMARENWKEFFYFVYYYIESTETNWIWLGFSNENSADRHRMRHFDAFTDSLIEDAETDMQNFTALRKVCVEFAKRACGNESTSATEFYDELYDLIVEEMEKLKPVMPSWLSNEEDRNNAILTMNTMPSISHISDPFSLDVIEYKKVDTEIFDEIYREYYRDLPSASGTSENQAISGGTSANPTSSGGASANPSSTSRASTNPSSSRAASKKSRKKRS